MQTKRYKAALNQLIAIDKRKKTDSSDILDFGIIMYENDNYQLAIDAFNHILSKGNKNELYQTANIEYLYALFLKYSSSLEPNIEEFKKLELSLTDALSSTPSYLSYKVIYALVNTKALYLNKYSEAIDLINNSIKNKVFSHEDTQEIKLLLGDIYFLDNNQWDAILTYAQVENTVKESPIGHEARFKKAKLAYYTGEFKWSQAQLDILKASTSKLIANDAMELSNFISENYSVDTTEKSIHIFARADFFVFSKQYEKALICLDSIIDLYPTNSLSDDVLYKKGFIYEATKNYTKAAEFYKKLSTDHSYDILADNALYKYAIIQEKLNNLDEAKEAYFKLISDYPGSIFTVDARKNLRKITDNNEQTD